MIPFMKSLLKTHSLLKPSLYSMASLMQKMNERQSKKQNDEFKKQLQYMANKPTFTYMDYKQRIIDELTKLQGNIKSKFSQDSKEAEKNLILEKKVMSALFEEELLSENKLDYFARKQVSIVTQLPIETVKQVIDKANSYKKLHRFLRDKTLKGEPLPESMNEMTHQFRSSKFYATSLQRRRAQAKQDRRRPSAIKKDRIRHMKRAQKKQRLYRSR